MIRADFHTHSDFSGDSHASMQSMIEAAVTLGLHNLCFTEHNDPDFIYVKPEEIGMFDLNTEKYLQKCIAFGKQYASKLNVLHGVELGVQEHLSEMLTSYIQDNTFDFVIASSHLCDGMDPYDAAFFNGRSIKDAFYSYFASIDRNISVFSDFDVYGHLDYVVRYAPDKNRSFSIKDYHDIFESIFKKLIQSGKGIEVNSGGYRAGLGVPNPAPEILRLYKECGGEIITIGSDAHKPEDIAKNFADIETILTAIGFRYYTVFKNRKPDFIKF